MEPKIKWFTLPLAELVSDIQQLTNAMIHREHIPTTLLFQFAIHHWFCGVSEAGMAVDDLECYVEQTFDEFRDEHPDIADAVIIEAHDTAVAISGLLKPALDVFIGPHMTHYPEYVNMEFLRDQALYLQLEL